MKGTYFSWRVKMPLGQTHYVQVVSGWAKDEDEGFKEIIARYPEALEVMPAKQVTQSGKEERIDTICSTFLPDANGWPFCVYCGQERPKHPVKSDSDTGKEAQAFIASGGLPRIPDHFPMD